MTHQETIHIGLAQEEATKAAGRSLAATLYGQPLTILLTGEVGSGKTTFFRAFAEAIGVDARVTSPTYALEQRYVSAMFGEVLHVDLYRLDAKQAQDLLRQSDHHAGIRCIEWADKLDELPDNAIHVHLEESGNGRSLTCTFGDIPLPSAEEITAWKKAFLLSDHIERHCDGVASMAVELAEQLMRERSVLIRPQALRAAALVHDLLRFLDFRPNAAPAGVMDTPQQLAAWAKIREQYQGLRHEAACAAFLRTHGYHAIATIVETHGAQVAPKPDSTIEQKLLFYADKRVANDKRVTLEERFQDFSNRYSEGKETAENRVWYEQAKALERELNLHSA